MDMGDFLQAETLPLPKSELGKNLGFTFYQSEDIVLIKKIN